MNTNNNDNGRGGGNAPRGRESVNYTDYNIFKGNVRLVGEGSPMVIDRDAAIEMAHTRGMNLVQIAYSKNDNPRSICRILDYSKYRYEQKRKEREEKRKRREAVPELKEIKFSIRIDEGDRNTKVKKIREILAEGDSVKVTIRLLRRELSKMDLARETMDMVVSSLGGSAVVDHGPQLNGNEFSCTIKPAAR